MPENTFAPINQFLEDRGYLAYKIEFKVNPTGRWLFYLWIGKKLKKVEYSQPGQLVRIYERRWLKFSEIAAMPVKDEEQAQQVAQTIIGG